MHRVNNRWIRAMWVLLVAVGALIGCQKSDTGQAPGGEKTAQGKVKIGFVVKQPEEPWFQNEWKFAQQAADKYGFDLVKIGATDGEKTLSAIDNLAAQGAQGMVICTPDVRLGPAIVARAKANKLKLMTVDDQLVGPDGKFLDAPHMGISAREIGQSVGKAIAEEMKKRGWKPEETAASAVTFDELDTARERVGGAIDALKAAGFPEDRIFKAPQKTTDVPGAFDAANIVLTQHGDVKNWVAFGLNDEAVLGAVRAMEGRGIPAERTIGVGIGGSTGMVDFKKEKPTGFFASVLISPKRHGYETAEYVYKWVKDGAEPPKLTLTSGMLIHRDNYQQVMKEQGVIE